jgi:hypothetical protein
MDTKIKTTTEKLEKLWERVPELSLGHLISLSVRGEDTLYQLSDDALLKKVGTFVATMENQKNIKRG